MFKVKFTAKASFDLHASTGGQNHFFFKIEKSKIEFLLK